MGPVLVVAATQLELCGREGFECGVGPVEAAAATARALAAGPPVAAVLHVGLAGGAGIPVGSLVVGTESRYVDIAAEWPVVDRAAPDARLVEAVLAALPRARPLQIETSARVAAPRETAREGPVVEAMEGFGVLRAAALAGVPAVEVRAISNELGEEDRTRWQVPAALELLGATLPTLTAAIEDAVRTVG
jgi:futalosine hydrolase